MEFTVSFKPATQLMLSAAKSVEAEVLGLSKSVAERAEKIHSSLFSNEAETLFSISALSSLATTYFQPPLFFMAAGAVAYGFGVASTRSEILAEAEYDKGELTEMFNNDRSSTEASPEVQAQKREGLTRELREVDAKADCSQRILNLAVTNFALALLSNLAPAPVSSAVAMTSLAVLTAVKVLQK